MLSQLTIENFGLIDKLTLECSPQLTVLTGSTGAGKSIIIDGLRFALGERIKSAQIREKDKPCSVEAVFELSDEFLSYHDDFLEMVDPQEKLCIISRQYLPDGRSRIRINGQTVTVAQLKNIGASLVDMHGPHDHQALLNEETHIMMLDMLTDFGNDRSEYHQAYEIFCALQAKMRNLEEMAKSRDRDLDLLGHQIKELEQVLLDDEAYEQLRARMARLNNATRLTDAGAALLDILENEQSGIAVQAQRAFSQLHVLSQNDESTQRFGEHLEAIQENADQLCSEIRDYLAGFSFEPGEAQQINASYDAYEDIKRKYGPSLSDARAFYTDAKEKYDVLIDIEHSDKALKKDLAASEKVLRSAASKLTTLRKKTAVVLKKTIERELKDLGFSHVEFEARIEPSDPQKNGFDRIAFFISPNVGVELKPLADIVSSGEAARLMLAIKRALTQVDPVQVLIFDEIDAQIGGRLGTVTGQKLKGISKNRQVILITHLPQIAAFADCHIKVTKEVVDNRTITTAQLLESQDRTEELAHMMDGDKKTDLSFTHARELLAQSQS